jgi:hypothetical protein
VPATRPSGRASRLHFLNAGHDHPLAVGEPALDDPVVADGARCLDRAQRDLVVRTHDERRGLPARVVRHADLGHEHRAVVHALVDSGAHEHPGQQHLARIREDGAHGHRAGALVDRDVGELERARLRVLRPVFQNERHLGLVRPVHLQPAAGHVATQFQAVDAGLSQVHVDRVDLLDGRHERRRARLHISALGDQRGAGAAGDRRDDVGIAQIDFGCRNGCLARGDVRSGLALRGDGVVVLLLADTVAADEDLVALCQCGGRCEVGLRLLQHRDGAIQSGAIRRRIDLVQPLVRLDVGAFLEFALQHNTVDSGADLRHKVRGRAARQFRGHWHASPIDCNHGDFRWLRSRRGLLRVAATGKHNDSQR